MNLESPAWRAYAEANEELLAMRAANNGKESKEEDELLAHMDVLWSHLYPEERELLNRTAQKITQTRPSKDAWYSKTYNVFAIAMILNIAACLSFAWYHKAPREMLALFLLAVMTLVCRYQAATINTLQDYISKRPLPDPFPDAK